MSYITLKSKYFISSMTRAGLAVFILKKAVSIAQAPVTANTNIKVLEDIIIELRRRTGTLMFI